MITSINKSFNYLFDFILPRFCVHCNKKLANIERFVCASCYDEIKIPSSEIIHGEYKRKFADKKFISGFASSFVFGKDAVIQSMIHSLKYNHNFLLGIYLGKLTAIELRTVLSAWNADMLMPVPLHSLKKAERGFNQSHYIAKGISKVTGIATNNRLIIRTRFTESQTTKNLLEREENMSGAFSCKNKKEVTGKKIILIDDVITTGSTINAVAGELVKAGAEKIYAVSVAITDS